jgi:tetratricopeptide (TPR) repeat protein
LFRDRCDMPTDITNDRRQRAAALDAMLQRAAFFIQHGQPADAEQLAAGILELKPGHAEATKILGYARLMLGRAKEALEPLEKTARQSRDPRDETQLAIALRQMDRREDALVWLKRAVQRKPVFAPAFHELGFILKSLHRLDEAIAVLTQGIEAAPKAPELAVQLGHAHYARDDRAKAQKYFAQALAVNVRHAEAINGLGMILMDQRDFAQAAELYRGALAANPADATARIGLGNCLLGLGQTEDAYAALRAATAAAPQLYVKALRVAVSSGRGRFWLRPSAAAKFFAAENPSA